MASASTLGDSALQGVYYLVFNLVKAVTTFLQRDSYLYWPFLVSTLAISLAVAVWSATGETGSRWGRFRGYFRAKVWWHPSARADYRLYFLNALLFPALAGLLVFSNGGIVSRLDGALSLAAAAPYAPSSPWAEAALRAAYTVVFFIAYDFARFVGHSLMHDVPFLWPFHKVHHTAEVLTPMTAYRVHPVELLIMAWIPALATGGVTWAFNRFAGAGISAYAFLGLHALIWCFNLIDNLRHSPVWLPYGKTLGRWLVSPAHHQVHHSVEPRHWGCNRGSDLAIWDRLYGTLYVPGAAEEFRMGLAEGGEASWHRVWYSYLQPFKESLHSLSARLPRSPGQRA